MYLTSGHYHVLKILENVIQSRIFRHLTKHNILSTEKKMFRIKDNFPYKLTTEILNAMNNMRGDWSVRSPIV
jgi:hypothetical protein